MTVDFCDYFWGEKNNGFDVLYQNTKHGQNASKELADFFKESALLEESYSKMQAKLASKANSAGVSGTFAPVWTLLRTSSERLSSIHLAAVTRLAELVKEVQKFTDDLHKRQKTVKEEEAPTMEVVQSLQQLTASVLKAREVYHQRAAELRRLQEAAQPAKDTDKAEAKLRKAAEEYRALVDKHRGVRDDFERKMVVSCRHFQELEENYLCQMKEFIDIYIKLFDASCNQIREVNVDLRRQCDEKTVLKLLEEFALAKHTGLEKPAWLEFEELPAASSTSVGSTPDAVSESGSAGVDETRSAAGAAAKQAAGGGGPAGDDVSTSSGGPSRSAAASPDGEPTTGRPLQLRASKWDLSSWQPQGTSWTSGFLRGRRKREKQSKSKRDNEKSDSEENHKSSPVVDEEGFSIRPRHETEKKKRHDSFYSSSDSDSDEDPTSKIHVKINPLSNGGGPISASVDELRTLASGLTLSPANTGSSKSPTIAEENSGLRRSQSQQLSQERPSNDLIGLSFHSPTHSNQSTPSGSGPRHLPSAAPPAGDGDRYAELSEIFAESSDMPPALPPKHQAPAAAPQRGATPTLSSIAIPRPPSRRSVEGVATMTRGRQSPALSSPVSRGPTPAPATAPSPSPSAASGSGTPRAEPVVGSSRGPSPLTLGLSDTVPLAVAFQEVVHAYFRGSDPSKCRVRMTGDTMVSFPSGIVQVLTSNPSPAPLVFRLKNTGRMENMLPNRHLITQELKLSGIDTAVFEFRMDNLTALLRRQAEKNPSASYFNVDILKYEILAKPGAASVPLQLVAYWKCEPTHTDLKVEYKYNSAALTPASALQNITVSAPVDGGVTAMHSKPTGKWVVETNRAMWRLQEVSPASSDQGAGALKARFELSGGPGSPSTLAAQFSCEGSTLSGAEFQLLGSGYRVSLVKRRFVSGKYLCDSDYVESSERYAAPPGPG
ncbi:F-BAR domain only protein 2-like isoform X9 [Amphibalanus amphitrite]|uniref:F-BAR domain only protein 2-like isoform X9 n=1 Tax=Amphibalanus amphitrite TaxID=1232801 RepID=UPI001C92A66B|nr:F-BAR domain only protein 2-like isoform X9 [Amphibalanus amphitrite]